MVGLVLVAELALVSGLVAAPAVAPQAPTVVSHHPVAVVVAANQPVHSGWNSVARKSMRMQLHTALVAAEAAA